MIDLELEAEIRVLTAQVLNSSVAALSSENRMALIALLASEPGTVPANADSERARSASGVEPMLTTAEAAVRLEVSRPYVAMLCDAGKLGDVIKTEGGHRRISAAAVSRYLAARTQEHAGASTPREAGLAAGLYDRDDDDYAKPVRNKVATDRLTPPRVASLQPSRKPRK